MNFGGKNIEKKKVNCLRWMAAALIAAFMAPGLAQAQLPPAVEAELRKLGPVVEPGCTAKLMRPLFAKNDYNTYWPVDASAPNDKVTLYSGLTLARDVKFGPEAKDLVDIFSANKGPANRTVLIYVPGGAGNKIEQQAAEANMFYDNIGKWATENGMVGVLMQRGGTAAGMNIAVMIEWLQANVAKYKGNPESMVLWAHSAGTGPLAQYIGRPDLYGIGVKGALFMSGNPNLGGAGGRGGGGGRGAAAGGAPAAGTPAGAPRGAAPGAQGGGAAAAAPAGGGGGRGGGGGNGVIGTSTCTNTAGAGSQAGVIRGPSSQLPDQGAGAAARRAELAGTSPWRWDGKQWISTGAQTAPPAAAGGAGGGRGGGGGGGAAAAGAGGARGGGAGAGAAAPAADAAAAPAFTTQDGFRSTRVKIALAWAELDNGAAAGMPPASVAIHDDLCKLEGPKAKDGVGHCPTMMWFKGESHMSEVFSLGSSDKTVATPVLAWIKSLQ